MSSFSEDSLSYLPRIAVLPKSQTKRRNPPGNPDPEAMVVALSPRTLLATNRYVCEVCHKGFQRDQNLQLHRRGHNLPWKLKQKSNHQAKKRVFVCPEVSCPHHHPGRALGDLTGIKKHYSRKHGEKKWKCDKCCKHYAVQSDLKAHSKICGTKEYRCDCGTVFSRRDSYVTHRAFCDSMTEESNGTVHGMATMVGDSSAMSSYSMPSLKSEPTTNHRLMVSDSIVHLGNGFSGNSNMELCGGSNRQSMTMVGSFMSATALLQKAAQMEPKVSNQLSTVQCRSTMGGFHVGIPGAVSSFPFDAERKSVLSVRREGGEGTGRQTQDFLGVGVSASSSAGNHGKTNQHELYSYHQMPHRQGILEQHGWDY